MIPLSLEKDHAALLCCPETILNTSQSMQTEIKWSDRGAANITLHVAV